MIGVTGSFNKDTLSYVYTHGVYIKCCLMRVNEQTNMEKKSVQQLSDGGRSGRK